MGGAVNQTYGRAFAQRLVELADGEGNMELRDDGIYLTQLWVEETEQVNGDWTPQGALTDSDPGSRKLLPIPFSSRDLAAFILCPAAAASALTDLFEKTWKLDPEKLRDAFVGAPGIRYADAMQKASDHLVRAQRIVGAEDHAQEKLARSLQEKRQTMRRTARERLGISSVSGHGLNDEEYILRVNQVNEEVAVIKGKCDDARRRSEKETVRWLDAMVEQIFVQESVENEATPRTQTLAQCEVDQPPPEWIGLAKEQAKAIYKRRKESDWFPNQSDVADEIARNFRERGIFGASGKPLSGAYIKRHALKGISGEKGRQLSTSNKRGK